MGKFFLVYVWYIYGDVLLCVYFILDCLRKEDLLIEIDCNYFNIWRYGFENFLKWYDDDVFIKEYFWWYIIWDVVLFVGYDDIKNEGD